MSYVIYAQSTAGYVRTFTLIPSGDEGRPICYDPGMWCRPETIASFKFDLTYLPNRNDNRTPLLYECRSAFLWLGKKSIERNARLFRRQRDYPERA